MTQILEQKIDNIKLYPFKESFDIEKILNVSSLQELQSCFPNISNDLSYELTKSVDYFLPLKRKYEKNIKDLFKFICNYKKTMDHINLKKEILGEVENEEELYNMFVSEVKKSCKKIYHQIYTLRTISNFIQYANNEYKKTDAFFSISCINMFNNNLVNENGKLTSDFDVFFNEIECLYEKSPSTEVKNKINKLLNLLTEKKEQLTDIYYQKIENNKD